MRNPIVDRLSKLCSDGEDLSTDRQFDLWDTKVSEFIRTAVGPIEADDFLRIYADDDWALHALRVGHLQGMIAKTEAQDIQLLTAAHTSMAMAANNAEKATPVPDSKRVFVVHGHDGEAKEGTARFLEKLGLQPIILHEQPNSGRTIIEKFEIYSGDIAFAVILLTPDDLGSAANPPALSKPRARQNVVMELGYFIGKLGRPRVAALYKGDVELPSDIQGVLYIEMDPAGAWKTKLAQEFGQVKLLIDISALLSG